MIPVFAILISAAIGNDYLSWRKFFGIVTAAFGVTILINPFKTEFSSDTLIGDILVLLNSFSYAFYVAVSKRFISKYGALKSIAWLFIFGSIINVPLGFYFFGQMDLSQVSAFSWDQDIHGGIVLSPTRDVVFFPMMLTLAPGEQRRIRVGSTVPAVEISARPQRAERTWRWSRGASSAGHRASIPRRGSP